MPAKFKNTVSFLRLGLPCTLIRHENEDLQKRSSNWRNLKTPGFYCRVDRKHLENGGVTSSCDSLTQFSSNKNPKWPVIFLWRSSMNGKHFMRFRSKTSVLNFLRRSVDSASDRCNADRNRNYLRMIQILHDPQPLTMD